MLTTQEEIAYLAGLFDGEGCIHISRLEEKYGPRFRLSVVVSMTVTAPLFLLRKHFGGKVYFAAKKKPKKQWYWLLGAQKAAEFLEVVLPALVVKDLEAGAGLLFQSTFDIPYRCGGNERKALPKEVVAMRELLWKECKDMKAYNA